MDWTRSRRFAAAVALAATLTAPVAGPAAAQDFRPLAPGETARLIVAPGAFHGDTARRSVADDGFIRYELLRMPFSIDRRFGHLLLREVLRGSPVANPASLREIVAQFLGGRTAAVTWQDQGNLTVGLGDAEFQTFRLAGMGCAGFVIDFGFGPAERSPQAVEGLYCDPDADPLALSDIERTLNAIGVDGVYRPEGY